MTPAEITLELDFALAENGTSAVFSRSGQTDVTAPAVIRSLTPDELTAGIDQNIRKMIVSPTPFVMWPSPPIEADRVLISGTSYRVANKDHIEIGGVIVRIELEVAG